MSSFKAIVHRMDSKVYGHYVEVPLDIFDNLSDVKRVIVTFNDNIKTHTAILSSSDGFKFVHFNQELIKKLKLKVGDSVDVHIQADNSKYGMELPQEFEELLEQDDEGEKHFHNLTPGKQRTLIHLIAKPKSSDIRLRKSIQVLNYLKSVNGALDFKELNEALKAPKGF